MSAQIDETRRQNVTPDEGETLEETPLEGDEHDEPDTPETEQEGDAA